MKERIQQSCWKTQPVPGAELASDLLTKPIVNPTLWQNFYAFIGARVLSKNVVIELKMRCRRSQS